MRNPMQLSDTSQKMLDHITDYHRKQFYDLDALSDKEQRFKSRNQRASLARAFDQMIHHGGVCAGPEAEFFQECARLAGRRFDRNKLYVPFAVLTQRDLTAASASSAGYLVGTANAKAQDILRPFSAVVSAGITVEENQVGNITIPKTTATSTISWQSTEVSPATPSTPTVQQVALMPKTAIAIINCSHNFMVQANPEQWLRRELARTAATAVDTAVLNGSGAAGQPLGLVNTSGLSTQSGTSLAWSGALTMKKNAAVANAQDGSVGFLSTPTVRALLEGREKASGNGGFIWQENQVADCPAFASTLMPAGAMLAGPMSGVTLAIWGSGLEIQINPYDASLFKSGVAQARVLVAVDVAITVAPSAFTLASSIT